MATTVSEAALLARARLGDEDAFTELYRQHLGYVRAMARGMLRKSDVEDVCQDIFLLAFTRLQGFAETSTFRAWVTRITINQCLLVVRARAQESNGEGWLVQVDEEAEKDQGYYASADEQLEGVPHRFTLDRLMRVLTPLERRVVTMAYRENLPYLEIAGKLGITPAAVKSTIHQAKQKMREAQKK